MRLLDVRHLNKVTTAVLTVKFPLGYQSFHLIAAWKNDWLTFRIYTFSSIKLKEISTDMNDHLFSKWDTYVYIIFDDNVYVIHLHKSAEIMLLSSFPDNNICNFSMITFLQITFGRYFVELYRFKWEWNSWGQLIQGKIGRGGGGYKSMKKIWGWLKSEWGMLRAYFRCLV